MSGETDSNFCLIQNLRSGDRKAIDKIVQIHGGGLFAFIYRMTGNYSTSEDIFQETWLRVIRHGRNFRGNSKFTTWLFQIAINLVRDMANKNKHFVSVPIDDYAEKLSTHNPNDSEESFKSAEVKKIIETLPLKLREILILKYYHSLSESEISEIAGCPPGTVKSRLHRAIGIIREKWDNLSMENTERNTING